MKMPCFRLSALVVLLLAFYCQATTRAVAEDSYPPCWRGELFSTYQSWSFNVSNNPAIPEVSFNTNGTASGTLNVGSFGTAWKSVTLGARTGAWDLGRNGSATLSIPDTSGSGAAWRYVYVQVTFYQDSLAYTAPTITLAGGTFVSTQTYSNAAAGPGHWKTIQSVWLVQPAGSVETISIQGDAVKGLLIDQVVVDTRTASGIFQTSLAGSCWRGGSGTTYGLWNFDVSNSPASIFPEFGTNGYGTPQMQLTPGSGALTYSVDGNSLGCVEGIWSLGNAGVMKLVVPNSSVSAPNAFTYVQLDVTQYRDNTQYLANASVTVTNGTFYSRQTTILFTNNIGGQWVVERSIWRVGQPNPSQEMIYVTAASGGALIDQVSVDTLNVQIPTNADAIYLADVGQCSKTNVIWTMPVADGCVITNVFATQPSGSTFSVGTNLVVYVTTDSLGGANTNHFKVVVLDVVPPTLICPSDMVVAKSLSQCGAVVNFSPVAADNCSGAVVYSYPPSGSLFPLGITTVSNIAYDASGNSSTPCTFTIRVVDYNGDVVVSRPCWRGNTNSTFQQWTFPVSQVVSSLTPDLATNSFGSPIAAIDLGLYSAGYIDNDSFLGCVQGIWDLGQYGSATFNVPTSLALASNSVTYLQVQVAQLNDGGIYAANAQVLVPGATLVGVQQQAISTNIFNTYTSEWLVEKSVWRLSAANTNAAVILNAGFYGALIDQVVVDTLTIDYPVATNIVTTADSGVCGKTNAAWFVPSADGCVITNVTSSVPLYSTLPVGTNLITYQIKDSLGGVKTNAFTFVVTDDERPLALTRNITVSLDAFGAALIVATNVDNGSTDNCGIYSMAVAPTNFSCVNLGSNTVTLIVTDIHGNSSTNTSVVTIIDALSPIFTNLLVTQFAAPVKNCLNTVVQGTVNISIRVSDNCSLAGYPVVLLTNGPSSDAGTFVNESPAGTFNYTWLVTNTTANGTWNVQVLAADSVNTASTNFTLCINKAQIAGLVQLQAFIGTKTVPIHSRTLVFVATTNNPVAGTNILKTWTTLLTNVTGDTFAYALTDVPTAANGLSAKTSWNLRRKLSLSLDTNLQSVVNFTTTNSWLLGGDVSGDNLVNTVDYLSIRGNFSLTNAPAADINGDGIINTTDYLLVRQWFGKRGDAQ